MKLPRATNRSILYYHSKACNTYMARRGGELVLLGVCVQHSDLTQAGIHNKCSLVMYSMPYLSCGEGFSELN